MEILVIAFVLEDVADTFELNSVQKGLIGSASFFGEPEGYSRVCRDRDIHAGCGIRGLCKGRDVRYRRHAMVDLNDMAVKVEVRPSLIFVSCV